MRHDPTTLDTPDESYFASFTDMLVGILFIFIILLMIAVNDFQEATDAVTNQEVDELAAAISQEHKKALEDRERALVQARNKELWKTQQDLLFDDREKILKEMQQSLMQAGIPVAVDVQQGVLRLPEHLLFSGGDHAVKDEGRPVLIALAGVLGTYLPCVTPTKDTSRLFACNFLNLSSTDGLDAVYILDNPLFNGSAEQQWLLSVQRTISIFRGLTYFESYLDTGLRNTSGVPILNVAAKKHRRLLNQNKNAPVRKTIEIWLKMRSPTPDDIKKLRMAEGIKGNP